MPISLTPFTMAINFSLAQLGLLDFVMSNINNNNINDITLFNNKLYLIIPTKEVS